MRRTLVIGSLLAFAAACSGRAVPTSVTLTPDDLPAVVLQASEAPAGTEYRVKQSGAEGLEKFGRPGEQRTTLSAAGFTGAYRVTVTSDAFVDHPSDPREWSGIDLIEHQAVTLKDAGGAQKIVAYYKQLLVQPNQSPDMEPVAVSGLGEEAYGFAGKIVRVAPAYVLYWRRGNVFSSLTLAGTQDGIDLEVVRRLAGAIDQRIAARA